MTRARSARPPREEGLPKTKKWNWAIFSLLASDRLCCPRTSPLTVLQTVVLLTRSGWDGPRPETLGVPGHRIAGNSVQEVLCAVLFTLWEICAPVFLPIYHLNFTALPIRSNLDASSTLIEILRVLRLGRSPARVLRDWTADIPPGGPLHVAHAAPTDPSISGILGEQSRDHPTRPRPHTTVLQSFCDL